MAKQRSLDGPEFRHPNKIGFIDGLGYAFGDAANLFVLTYVSSYLKVFYTDILKVAEEKGEDLESFLKALQGTGGEA